MAALNNIAVYYGKKASLYTCPTLQLKYSVATAPHYYENDKCEKQKKRIGSLFTVDISGILEAATPAALLTAKDDMYDALATERGSGDNTTSTALLKIYIGSTAVYEWEWTTSVATAKYVDGGFHNKLLNFPDELPKTQLMQPWNAQFQFIVLSTANVILCGENNIVTEEVVTSG